MFEAMTSSPFFGLALTLICWWLAVRLPEKRDTDLQSRFGHKRAGDCHPADLPYSAGTL